MKAIMIMFIICLYTSLFSLIIEVDINGSTPFQEIQSGIDVSVDGDTVLVYPGTYLENVIIENKSIVLAGMEMTTGDSTYIENTIIDGNQNGSCIYVENFTDGIIQGFTIQNGSGTYDGQHYDGAGCYILSSNITIKNCIVTNNESDSGGALLLENSNVFLSGSNITFNHSLRRGNILLWNNSEIYFDEQNLCNIYMNTAGQGNDFWINGFENLNIILSTYTVMEPDYEFIYMVQGEEYSFSCQQAVIEQVQNDLYVNPNGSDANYGLTPDDPLKTIAYANLLIKADSLNPRIIYAADGLYSNNATGEHLPINLKSYVSIIGESEENTIIDGDVYYPIMTGMNGEREVVIKNFTFQNSQLKSHHRAPLRFCYTEIDEEWYRFTVTLENITIKGVTPRTSDDTPDALSFIDGDRINMKNVTIEDNVCDSAAHLWTMNLEAENFIVRNTHYIIGSESVTGSAIPILRHNSFFPEDNPLVFKNLLICSNEGVGDIIYPPLAFNVAYGAEAYVINGTFVDNSLNGSNSGIVRVTDDSKLTLINSVIHDIDDIPVYVDGDDAELAVDHCFITNGYDDIHIVGEPIINWLEGNISGNPDFQGEGSAWPYNYLSTSPCINTGTLDLPAGIELPELDLAGNPRIYGATIDIGAYEWQGVGSTNNELELTKVTLSNFPNPFNPSTTISFSVTQNSDFVNLEVYNIKGQKVKTLISEEMQKGKHTIIWSGLDKNNKSVSSGVYFYKLKVNSKTEETKKMLLLK